MAREARYADEERWDDSIKRRAVTLRREAHLLAEYRCPATACAACHVSSRYAVMHRHHIDHDWTNNQAGNLVPLCASCHSRYHAAERKWRVPRGDRSAMLDLLAFTDVRQEAAREVHA